MIGERFGSYEIVGRLGKGGMGVVYAAEHAALKSKAAVKTLLPELSGDKELVTRFFNEAKAATQVRHPGIVQIFDYGFHERLRCAYIVMELLDGESLAARIRRGRLAPLAAATIARQVASALGAAHRAGIVHRDLKPDNLFLVPDPDAIEGERVKVLDFGVAKLAGSISTEETRTGQVFGTPLYMSPEQCRSAASVDARTDIYALGCILYEMLAGTPPFRGGSITELITAHLFQDPTPPSREVDGIPATLEQTVLRAIAKSADDRHPDMAAVTAELDAITGRRMLTPIPVRVSALADTAAPSSPHVGVSTTLQASAGQLAAPRRTRRGVVIGGAVLIGAAAVAIAIYVVAQRTDRASDAAPTPAAPSPIAIATTDAQIAADDPRAQHADAGDPRAALADAGDPRAALAARMTSVMHAFVAWSRDHQGASCPDLATLGMTDRDLTLTCTDQPAEQVIGVIASNGTASWQLGPAVTDLVRGSRWPSRHKIRSTAPPPSRPVPRTTAPTNAHVEPPPALQLDDNGLPMKR